MSDVMEFEKKNAICLIDTLKQDRTGLHPSQLLSGQLLKMKVKIANGLI